MIIMKNSGCDLVILCRVSLGEVTCAHPCERAMAQHLIHNKKCGTVSDPDDRGTCTLHLALALHCAALRCWSGQNRASCLNLNYTVKKKCREKGTNCVLDGW